MVWLLVIGVGVLAIVLLAKHARTGQALHALINDIRPTLLHFESDGGVDARIWTDPYVLGYIYGRAGLALKSIAPSLSSEKRAELVRLMMIEFDPVLGRTGFQRQSQSGSSSTPCAQDSGDLSVCNGWKATFTVAALRR